MRKAFSYTRFSTPDQAKGDSFRRQTEFSKQYAEKHGLVLDESTSIRDLGVSAFRGSNVNEGALAGFLELVKGGKVPKGSVLIVESLDRLSRDQLRPALKLFMGILEAGVSIVTLNPEREYTPENQDVLSLFEPLIYFSRAHEESATKSRRVGENWDQKRKKAAADQTPMTTVCPKWLEVVEGKFAVLPERVRLVREIVRWTLDGMGTYAIVRKLTTDGVPGWGKGAWNTAYVRAIITDRRVLGECQPKKLANGKMVNHGPPIPDYYPRLIEDSQFYEALSTIKRRAGKGGRGGSKRENVLSGLVYNTEDGSKMHYGTHRNRKPFLESNAAYYGRDRPAGVSFPYHLIEEAVLSTLCELKPEMQDTAEQGSRVSELDGRLRDLQQRVEKTLATAATATNFDLYLTTIETLESERKRLAGELEAARAADQRTHSPTDRSSLIELRRGDSGAARERMNARLRVRIENLVESVWVRIENRTRTEKTAYVQVYLKNEQRRLRVVHHPKPPSDVKQIKQYDDRDFKGEVRARR